MPSVEVHGTTIEYDERGEGRPLLLVMGLSGQLVDWPDELVDLFVARGFRVIRFDNRDSGLSTEFAWDPPSRWRTFLALVFRRKPKAGYVIDDMAADAAGVLDHLGIHAAHVVGISMGGMIAQALAIGHPARVASLTSIMSNTGDGKHGRIGPRLMVKLGRLGEPTREAAVEQFLAVGRLVSGPHFDEGQARPVVERSIARSYRPGGVARQMAAIGASADRTAGLAGVTAPTLVVHGLLDQLVRLSGGIATARAVPGSRLLIFPDMAHDLPRPRWEELVDAITANADRAG
jgi:pimeloyl-ACP methyl ester carboxylesterase